MKVLTIGHSTRPVEIFVRMLRQAGIAYAHLGGLGGLRHARKDSRNTGWRNASFRGYAKFMETPEFEAALQALIEAAQAHAVRQSGRRTGHVSSPGRLISV